MPVAVFIGGPPNAGKSTLAAGVACHYPNTCFIDGDHVLDKQQEKSVAHLPKPQRWQKRFAQITALVQRNSAEELHTVVAWPLNAETHATLKTELHGCDIFYIYLNLPADQLKQARPARPSTAWEMARAHAMHEHGYVRLPFCDLTVNNLNATPFQAMQEVRQKLLDKVFAAF